MSDALAENAPVPTPSRRCRHCRKSSVSRPRGLCWGCYYTPGVRDLYPITSKFARRANAAVGTLGLCGPMTLQEVARVLGISPSRVSQIERTALQKMRERLLALDW